jgi:hypothetical protein
MVEIQSCPSPIFMSQMSSREIAEYVSSENPPRWFKEVVHTYMFKKEV